MVPLTIQASENTHVWVAVILKWCFFVCVLETGYRDGFNLFGQWFKALDKKKHIDHSYGLYMTDKNATNIKHVHYSGKKIYEKFFVCWWIFFILIYHIGNAFWLMRRENNIWIPEEWWLFICLNGLNQIIQIT